MSIFFRSSKYLVGLNNSNFCLEFYVELSSYKDEVVYQMLLGKTPCTDLSDAYLKSFQRMCYLHATKLAAEYNRAVSIYPITELCILTIASANELLYKELQIDIL